MRPVSDAQVRKVMEEMSKHARLGRAALKADMDRKTARKYVKAGKLPSECSTPRTWRTREDPFEEHWAEIEQKLVEAPTLEAKAVFGWLMETHPGRYEPGQVRTLQRHVRTWRAERGPEKEAVLAQQHRPGEAAQTDFTWATELSVTISGHLFVHMLCVFVLPYSNWRWATVCLSESIAAVRRGVQRALFQLGRAPEWHQTDNSTSATHRIPDGKSVAAHGPEQASVQRGIPRDHAPLWDEAAHDGDWCEGAKRRRRGGKWRAQTSLGAGAALAREPRLHKRRCLAVVRR